MDETAESQYFHEYFAEWIEMYKLGAVRPVTYQKYLNTLRRLNMLAPTLRICQLDKRSYQALLNDYARTHERQTTMDFHHHLKSAILDAIDEGLLTTDPTRKITIKGKAAIKERNKFLNQCELEALLKCLNLIDRPNWDWCILLCAKTGLRLSEALGLTPADLDFTSCVISVNKTWNYKSPEGGFAPTKNKSSVRKVAIDRRLSAQLSVLVKGMDENKPVFVQNGERVFNSTVNYRLKILCKKAEIPIISVHSLRHTHASLLIFEGVSVASIAARLGHANITTTQETYIHIIKELEAKDSEKITQYLASLA